MQFFKLLVDGQHTLREKWKHEVEQRRKAERLRNKRENAELGEEETEADAAQDDEDAQYEQQIIVKSNMIYSSRVFVNRSVYFKHYTYKITLFQ